MIYLNRCILISLSFYDSTLQDSAEKILRVSSQELGEARERDEVRYNSIFSKGTFRTFNFKMRAKADTYNDETRVKHTVTDWTLLFWIIYVVPPGGGRGRGRLCQVLRDSHQ